MTNLPVRLEENGDQPSTAPLRVLWEHTAPRNTLGLPADTLLRPRPLRLPPHTVPFPEVPSPSPRPDRTGSRLLTAPGRRVRGARTAPRLRASHRAAVVNPQQAAVQDLHGRLGAGVHECAPEDMGERWALRGAHSGDGYTGTTAAPASCSLPSAAAERGFLVLSPSPHPLVTCPSGRGFGGPRPAPSPRPTPPPRVRGRRRSLPEISWAAPRGPAGTCCTEPGALANLLDVFEGTDFNCDGR